MESQPRWTSESTRERFQPEAFRPRGSRGVVLATPELVHRGRVKWFSSPRRFGFIVNDQTKEEIFFHQSNVHGPPSFQLVSNQPVNYRIRMTFKGPEAYQVQPIDSHGSIPFPHLPTAWSGGPVSMAADTWLSASSSSAITPTRRPVPESGPRGQPEHRSLRRFRCYNCGQYASHKAAFCPMEILQKCCYRCRSSTHLFADCPLQHTHYRKRVTAGQHISEPFVGLLAPSIPDRTEPGSILKRL